jgi:hypothetical protein
MPSEQWRHCAGGIYLSTTSGVLRSTTSNELSIVVLDQILVKSHMLLLRQNSIVGLETILLEQLLVSAIPCQQPAHFVSRGRRERCSAHGASQWHSPNALDIEERVLQTEKLEIAF